MPISETQASNPGPATHSVYFSPNEKCDKQIINLKSQHKLESMATEQTAFEDCFRACASEKAALNHRNDLVQPALASSNGMRDVSQHNKLFVLDLFQRIPCLLPVSRE